MFRSPNSQSLLLLQHSNLKNVRPLSFPSTHVECCPNMISRARTYMHILVCTSMAHEDVHITTISSNNIKLREKKCIFSPQLGIPNLVLKHCTTRYKCIAYAVVKKGWNGTLDVIKPSASRRRVVFTALYFACLRPKPEDKRREGEIMGEFVACG